MTIRVDMVSVWTKGGYRYDVFLGEEKIVERSRVPSCDACRVLAGRGLDGKVEVWRRGSSYPAMIADIERTGNMTVSENEKVSPRFSKWKPFEGGLP
jgi:hypothetical protein